MNNIDSQFIQNVAHQPGLTWQQRVKQVTDRYGIRANEAAKLLNPYYTSQLEHMQATLYSVPEHKNVRALTYLDQQYFQKVASQTNLTWPQKIQTVATQYSIDAARAAQLLSPYQESQTAQSPSGYDSEFLRSVAQQPGINWQQRVKQVTDRYGIRANEAAKLLNPYYVSKNEMFTYIPLNNSQPQTLTYSQIEDLLNRGAIAHYQVLSKDNVGRDMVQFTDQSGHVYQAAGYIRDGKFYSPY